MSEYNWNLKNVEDEKITIISKSIFKVGRNPQADLITDHREVSRNHATLSVLIDGLYVTDNKSSNGTFINGEKIKPMELIELKLDDIVGFGWHQNMCEELNFKTPPLVFKVSQTLPSPILEISLVSSKNEESFVEEKAEDKDSDCVIIPTAGPLKDVHDQVEDSSTLMHHKKIDDCFIVSSVESSSALEKEVEEKLPDTSMKSSIDLCGGIQRGIGEKLENIVADCIVLSSDDEDEPFESSQIFAISKRIKQEQMSFHDSIDPYSEIKQELEDLDYCSAAHQVVVDVTDDVDHFENTTDLLNILENTQEMDRVKSSPDTSTNVKNNEERSYHENSKKPDMLKNTKVQQKYLKPPIIEPHVDIKPCCSSSKGKKDLPAKIATKRKSTSKQENLEINKKYKLDNKTKEERKKRLRELATKTNPLEKDTSKIENVKTTKKVADPPRNENTTATIRMNDADSCRNGPAQASGVKKRTSTPRIGNTKVCVKVQPADTSIDVNSTGATKVRTADTSINKSTEGVAKMTDGRGKFLLHEIDVPPISRSARDPRSRYRAKPPPVAKEKETVAGKTSQNSIQDTTVSSNLSPSSDEVVSTWRNPANSGAHPDSTDQDDRSGLIWKLGAYRQTPKLPHTSMAVDDLNEDISALVCWSVKWLLDQGGMDVSPPVNGNRPLMKVPLSFKGFAQYEALMNPLIKLELWQFIYQTTFNKEDERTPIKAHILHERKVYPVCCLDCELFLSDAENRENPFRSEDVSLIEIKLKNSSNWFGYTSYGYLKSVQRSSTRDGHHVKITMVIKHYAEEIFGTRIFIKVIANIGNYLRLIRTIKHLQFSPLCKYILNPDSLEPVAPALKTITDVMPITLNREQIGIVADASQVCLKDGPGIYLIKGPPGTGKSTVIVGIIMETLLNHKWGDPPPLILLTAPSNAAVDGLILKLYDARSKLPDSIRRQLKLVRIGPDSSISQNVNKLKLDVLARNNIISSRGLSSMIEYKTSMEKGENTDLFLRRHLGQNYHYEMRFAEDNLLMKSNIICTTLNSCVSHRILQATRRGQLKFTCCIVDEATQCNELESLLPIQLGIQKFVLVGDPKQLPAVVCNKEAYRLGFGQSLFYRFQNNFSSKSYSPVKMLCTQYRMKPDICEYPNKTFYEGRLRSSPTYSNAIEPALRPYLVFNLTRLNEDKSDYVNADEACLIRKMLETLMACVKPSCTYSIGIITPYRAQKDLISQHISGLRMRINVSISVNTVDSFQGLENDVIIISSVRNKNNNFLQNEQRLNVALTRAKQALYIIGNYALFKHCKPLYDLREDAKRRKLLLDIRDDPRNISSLKKYILKDA